MSDYYISSSNLTFSLYNDKILYNEGSGSNISTRKECTQYWFNQQNKIYSLEEILQISYIVSGSNSYIKDNGWSTKTISDVVNVVMTDNSFDETFSIELIKDTNPLITDWSI